jgi:hypothetical protein
VGLVVLLMLAACGPVGTGPSRTGTIGGTSGTQGQSLVGTWRRTIVFQHGNDFTTSETTWLFAPDGSCERRVATTTVSAGFTDTTSSTCRWSVAGTVVTIQFDGAGSAQFSWSVQGGTLQLNGVLFERV